MTFFKYYLVGPISHIWKSMTSRWSFKDPSMRESLLKFTVYHICQVYYCIVLHNWCHIVKASWSLSAVRLFFRCWVTRVPFRYLFLSVIVRCALMINKHFKLIFKTARQMVFDVKHLCKVERNLWSWWLCHPRGATDGAKYEKKT